MVSLIEKDVDKALILWWGKNPKPKRKTIPPSIKNEVMARQNYKCHRCMDKLPPTKHFHHVKPVSKGGNPSLDNIIVVCPNCHSYIHHKEQVAKQMKKAEKSDSENYFENLYKELWR